MQSDGFRNHADTAIRTLLDQGGAFGLSRHEALREVVRAAGKAAGDCGMSSAISSDCLLQGYVVAVAARPAR